MNTNINPSSYQTTKDLYREVIRQTLIEHNVASIRFTPAERSTCPEWFFDEIILHADLTLTVIRDGIQSDNFYFDFTNDFARCLSNIEDAIYCEAHHMEPTTRNYHGLTVEFNK